MKERRMFERFKTLLEIFYATAEGNGKQKVPEVKDICGGGANLQINEELRVGTKIALEISIPGNEEHIYLNGKVGWIKQNNVKDSGGKKYSTGVVFNNPDLLSMGKFLHAA